MLLAVIMTLCVAVPAFAANISIYLDGEKIATDVDPEVKNATTFVPVRVISEKLGADVEYYNNEVLIQNFDDKESVIMLTLGSDTTKVVTKVHLEGNVNDPEIQKVLAEDSELAADIEKLGATEFGGDFSKSSEVKLLAAPYVKNNRTMLPLRFVSEQLGCTVDYKNGVITITSGDGIALDGQKVAVLKLVQGTNIKTVTNKKTVSTCASLIEKCRGAKISKPANVSAPDYQGYQYNFVNIKGEAVASWQFYVPTDEKAKTSGWSALYLYDVLNDVYYQADASVYEEYFYGEGNLEPSLNYIKVDDTGLGE
jgi:hypothetical protein